MLIFLAALSFICLLLWHFCWKKKLEEQFDRLYDSWGLLIEQKDTYLLITNLELYITFISLLLIALSGAILNMHIYDLILGSFIMLIIVAIIPLFKPANVSYEVKDIKNDTPFRIWNYLAFKGEKKLNIQLWGIFLPNPTTPAELTKVSKEINSLSQNQRDQIINSLKSSKFQRVSNKLNKSIASRISNILRWLFGGLTGFAIVEKYFNGDYKKLFHYIISHVLILLCIVIVYGVIIFIYDKCTTKNRKDFAREKLFELLDIK